MDFTLWLAFFAASWAISLSPGPGAIAAMSSGLSHGFARGYWTTLGLVLGIWTQTAIVGVGLGALIQTSEWAFAAVKWAGVAYLLYLGVQQWRAKASPVEVPVGGRIEQLEAPGKAHAPGRLTLLARGWMINTLNPKGTLFLLAVVPQFLHLTEPLTPQYLAIAATLGFTDLVVMAGYTLLAARLVRWLRRPSAVRGINRLFGGLFIAAAAVLASLKRAS